MKSPYAKTVGYELLHAARLHRARSAQLLQELGLFPGQEQVLTLLAASEDGRTMGDLASELRVRPPTASKTVARLSVQGLVERRTVDGDGRVVRVELTEEGRRRAEAVESVWGALEKEACDGVDGKDRKRIRKLLRKVGANLGAQLGAAHDDDEPDDED